MPPYLEKVQGLIREYTEWLGRDLAFQDLGDEQLASMGVKTSDIDAVSLPPMGLVEHEQKRHESQRLAGVRSLCTGRAT